MENQEMSEKNNPKVTADQLPEEVLIEVFGYLPPEDLNSACLVNTRWRNIIYHSKKVMSSVKLKLDLLDYNWEDIWSQMRSNSRKYPKVEISGCDSWKNVGKVFRKLSIVQNLVLMDCDFQVSKTKQVVNALKFLKKLETLKIKDSDINAEIKGVEGAMLPSLKSLVIIDSNSSLLKLVKTKELKTLKIKSDRMASESYFIDFLCNQKSLTELAFRSFGWEMDPISIEKISSISCPLKKLSLTNLKLQFRDDKLVMAFMKNFPNTLEELEIDSKVSNTVYEFIFKEFKKLTILNIGIKHADEESFRNLTSNYSVKNLVIKNPFGGSRTKNVIRIIENLPNVESLVLDMNGVTTKLMTAVSNNLTKLHTINFQNFDGRSLSRVSIPTIKNLKIVSLESLRLDDWKKTVRALPNVESFSVEILTDSMSMTNRFNIIAKAWNKLQTLKLGIGFSARKCIFSQLLKHCKNIKTVEMFSSALRGNKDALIKDFHKEGLLLIIRDPVWTSNSSLKVNERFGELWNNESIDEDSDSDSDDFESWSEDDDDFDFPGFNGDEFGLQMFAELIRLGRPYFGSSEDEYIYFDSDGEMRNWNEDPGDYF